MAWTEAAVTTDEPEPEPEKTEALWSRTSRKKQHPLEGQPAPIFKLALLNGGEFDLAAHRNKHIVILDFWATWCRPCRMALPMLAQVAELYKDRSVVFCAVNQQESSDRIRDFMKDLGLKCSVALDRSGEVASLYKVRGIPQTVIIGKDGKIQSVHIGLLPGLKKMLKQELDVLLGGGTKAASAILQGRRQGV